MSAPMTPERERRERYRRAIVAATRRSPLSSVVAEAAMAVADAEVAALRDRVAELERALAARPTRAEVLRAEVANLRRVEREDMPEAAPGVREGLLRAALVLDERADTAEGETGGAL